MKIILTNGTELNTVIVTGGTKYVQGANRDALTFVFSESYSMDELDTAFTDTACESINIVGNDGSKAIHTGYTIRATLEKKRVETQKATESAEAAFENRIFVTMAQRTYSETKMAEMQEALELILSGDTGEEA